MWGIKIKKNHFFNYNLTYFTDTSEFRFATIAFNGLFVISCLLAIVAALKIWKWLLIPYIILDLIRLCCLLSCHIVVMMIYKKQINLGVLIALSSAGGFFLLYLGYMWCCSISLFQMIGVINSKSYQKLLSNVSKVSEKNLKNNSNVSYITPGVQKTQYTKTPIAGVFASDFSEYYKRHDYRN